MPQVDLTTLNETELRRLLGATRERGQAGQTYQILQEMAARREAGGPGLFRPRRPGEPRVIALDLDDPAEESPEPAEEDDIPPLPPGWVPRAPRLEAAALQPPAPTAKTPEPRTVKRRAPPRAKPPAPAATPRPSVARKRVAAPAAGSTAPKAAPATQAAPAPQAAPAAEPRPTPRPLTSFRIEPAPQPPPQPTRSPWLSRWSGLIFAGGVALGVSFGWWAGEVTRNLLQENPGTVVAAKAAAPVIRPAAARPEAAPQAPDAAAAQPPASDAGPAPSAAEFVQNASATANALPPPSPSPAEASADPPANSDSAAAGPVQIARAPPAGCAAEPTAADRTICETPRLQKLQRELRSAYREALSVHQDRDLLRERQLAWREARNDIAEPGQLARVYDERIRRLHAATAEARRGRRRG